MHIICISLCSIYAYIHSFVCNIHGEPSSLSKLRHRGVPDDGRRLVWPLTRGAPRGFRDLSTAVVCGWCSLWLPRTWGESILHFIRRSHEKSGWWGLPKKVGDPPWPHVSQVRDGGWKWGIQMAHFHRNMTVKKTLWISGGFQFLDVFHVFFRQTHILHDPRTVIAPNC